MSGGGREEEGGCRGCVAVKGDNGKVEASSAAETEDMVRELIPRRTAEWLNGCGDFLPNGGEEDLLLRI
jgi:hypothetical protein